jgi:hypothetical protein
VSLRVHQSRPGVPVIALGNFRFQKLMPISAGCEFDSVRGQ